MRALNLRLGSALVAALLAFTASPALACRVAPQPNANETAVSVEVTVEASDYERAGDELGAWRAVGRTNQTVPPPLKSDEIKFAGYENLFGCIPGYDRPAIGSRWRVLLGINPEGQVRLINFGPVPNP